MQRSIGFNEKIDEKKMTFKKWEKQLDIFWPKFFLNAKEECRISAVKNKKFVIVHLAYVDLKSLLFY